MPTRLHPDTNRALHCLRRAYNAASAAYDLAKTKRDPVEALEAMRSANDFLAGTATMEAEIFRISAKQVKNAGGVLPH